MWIHFRKQNTSLCHVSQPKIAIGKLILTVLIWYIWFVCIFPHHPSLSILFYFLTLSSSQQPSLPTASLSLFIHMQDLLYIFVCTLHALLQIQSLEESRSGLKSIRLWTGESNVKWNLGRYIKLFSFKTNDKSQSNLILFNQNKILLLMILVDSDRLK